MTDLLWISLLMVIGSIAIILWRHSHHSPGARECRGFISWPFRAVRGDSTICGLKRV